MDLKVMETLFRLVSEAMRGTVGAQDAIRSLAELPTNREEMVAYIEKNLPNVGKLSQSDLYGEQLEQWFRMMGFVPRTRYLELLERYEDLRLRLEEAENTHRRLESMLDPSHVASGILSAWGTTLQRTLDAQAEWMNIFLGQGAGAASESEPEEETEATDPETE